MIGSRWFYEPDDERESWCFLTLEWGDSEGTVKGWRVGYGNPVKMVRTKSCKRSDEKENLQELLKELCYCKKTGIELITFEPVLQKVRTRIVRLGLQNSCLKIAVGICIQRVLKEYFAEFGSKPNLHEVIKTVGPRDFSTSDLKSPEILREILLAIGPIIPKRCFRGGSGC